MIFLRICGKKRNCSKELGHRRKCEKNRVSWSTSKPQKNVNVEDYRMLFVD